MNMRFGAKRNNLLGFLVLIITTLLLAWSLFFTGEKLGIRSIQATNEIELSGAIIVKRMKFKPVELAKLASQRPPEPPPPPPQGRPGSKP